MGSPAGQRFEFTEQHFEQLRVQVKRIAGIDLGDSKQQMMYSRLSRRLRKLELHGFDDYCQLLENEHGSEIVEFVNALTTNLTYFFRESHHFDTLADEAIPSLLRTRKKGKRIRMWSAGCSTGQEPYSMAMVARQLNTIPAHWDFKILASDLDSAVVATGKRGIYAGDALKGLSPEQLRRWGTNVQAPGEKPAIKMSPRIKSLVTFKQLNLIDPWPMTGQFDVIFCRNVVIYFDKSAQRKLFDRMADILAPDGWLFVGHSENLSNMTDRFELTSQSTYRKVGK